MRIISKFKDYYDGIQFYYGEDVVYIRDMNLRTIEKDDNGNEFIKNSIFVKSIDKIFKEYLKNSIATKLNWNDNNRLYLFQSFLILGEKTIPFISLTFKEYKDVKFFSYEELEDFYNINIKALYKSEICFNISRMKDVFTQNYNDLYKKIRTISNEVIISYTHYKDEYDVSRIIAMDYGTMLNPNLKSLGFSKIITAEEVIQEIELFISKLNNIEKDVIMDNDIKIINAGFNENSFRNRK